MMLCVIVAQKPWGKKRTDDIVNTGAGALNVDGGRIGINLADPNRRFAEPLNYGKQGNGFLSGISSRRGDFPSQGRWPPNFALVHKKFDAEGNGGCERAGVRRIRGDKRDGSIAPTPARSWKNQSVEGIARQGHADPDGYERVDDWKCEPGCVCAKLGEQSGERPGAVSNSHKARRSSTRQDACYGDYNDTKLSLGYADKGTAARFYFQADWEYERMERTRETTGGDMGKHEIICDDVIRWAKEYKERIDGGEAEPFHVLLSDPPYHLHGGKGKGGFMNKAWDGPQNISFQKETWATLAEVLHPGAFLFVFASSRGWHRLACALEDAGLIIQPSIFVWGTGVVEVPPMFLHLQGQAFPKASRTHKAPKPKRQRLYRWLGWAGKIGNWFLRKRGLPPRYYLDFVWEGHRYGGQILKDAASPIVVAQKSWTNPRRDCIVRTGAGAMNVDCGRIHAQPGDRTDRIGGTVQKWGTNTYAQDEYSINVKGSNSPSHPQGRWPPNFCLIHQQPHLCPDCEGEGCESCGGEGVVGGCKRAGVKRVKGNTNSGETYSFGERGIYGTGKRKNLKHYADPDGLETVTDWRCEKGCPALKLGEQAGERMHGAGSARQKDVNSNYDASGYDMSGIRQMDRYGDTGGASRFYHNADWSHEIAERLATSDPVRYCPKSAKRERASGLDDFYWRKDKSSPIGFTRITEEEWEALGVEEERVKKETGKRVSLRAQGNIHPCVKPISLIKWISSLSLPPKEYAPRSILISFCGTFSEGVGAVLAGWDRVVGIDIHEDYCAVSEARARWWTEWLEKTGESEPKAILKVSNKKPKRKSPEQGQLL